MSAYESEQCILLNLVEFTQSSGALGVPCYMTDRGARPSLWRRPGLVLHTTGDVTPVTITNPAVLRPSPLKILFASSGAAAVLQPCAQSCGECLSTQHTLLRTLVWSVMMKKVNLSTDLQYEKHKMSQFEESATRRLHRH